MNGRAIAPSDNHNSFSTADSSNIRSLVANPGEKNSQTQSESDGKRKSSSSSGQEEPLQPKAQKSTDALLMDVPIMLSKEEFALSMVQRSKSNNAAAKDKSSTEDCALSTEQR